MFSIKLYFLTKFIKISNSIKKKYSKRVPNGYGLSHEKYLNIFISNLLKKKYNSPPVDAKDAAMTQRLIHAIYSSHEKRKWIKISKNAKSFYLGK